jgi:bacterial/archaeal transporter family protein
MLEGRWAYASHREVQSMTSAWFYWALLSAVFAAMTAIFAKIGIKTIDSDFATLVRTVIIFFVLTAFVVLTKKWTNPFACYFRALKIGEASSVAPVDKFSVVLVAIFAVIFLGERPGLKDWVGIALVGLGVVVLALKK